MMRKSSRILVAATFAGLAVAGGAAFTATGVTQNAPATQFVGGTVSQTVTGATLNNVAYAYADGSNTAVSSIDLTFALADAGHTVTVVPAGAGAGTFTQVAPVTVDGTGHAVFAYVPAAAEAGYVGLTGITVSVTA